MIYRRKANRLSFFVQIRPRKAFGPVRVSLDERLFVIALLAFQVGLSMYCAVFHIALCALHLHPCSLDAAGETTRAPLNKCHKLY